MKSDAYLDFVRGKLAISAPRGGIDVAEVDLGDRLFPFQRQLVRWALGIGKAALFADCGLGKGPMQLEWARQVCDATFGRVLILAPLAVSQQTVREGAKFGIPVVYGKDEEHAGDAPIVITNYERLGKFDASKFAGVVIDESGCIRNYSGALKAQIFAAFAKTPYKLACSATPAPNDHMELGQHAEFLDVLTSHEMLARWFINDTTSFGTYRLKGHAARDFWDWTCSWARYVGTPADLGFSADGYELPGLDVQRHIVDVDVLEGRGEELFRTPDMSATAVHQEKRRSVANRARRVAEIVSAEPNEPWLIWCETDYEEKALREVLPGAVVVNGKDSIEDKEERLGAFADGSAHIMITKAKIAGYGLNFQHCARMAFVGPTFSYEAFYQAIRRCHRFGQKRPVRAHVVMATTEVSVWDILTRKSDDHKTMAVEMFASTRRATSHVDDGAAAYGKTKSFKLAPWIRTQETAS